ncbi:hypothetical protein ACFCV3_18750 [Kribbella sp. NPDC056345]|uniref:hypothetical protein n=1 Tax=Kribbella sp. NPDC056345 TaxID=3345789 RepID=UPI0035DEEAFF
MFRVVRATLLAAALVMGALVPTVGNTAPAAAAVQNKAYLKLVFNCGKVGGVSVTIEGPGVRAGARDTIGTYYFQGRGGIYIVKRLANGRIAPKTAYLSVRAGTTRTVLVCNSNWA